MKERGLFLIKPDAVLLGETKVAVERISEQNLEVVDQKTIQLNGYQVNKLYADKKDHLSQYWHGYLTTMPSELIVVEGEDANEKLGEIKQEMRREFKHDNFYTGTHSSDNQKKFYREIKILT